MSEEFTVGDVDSREVIGGNNPPSPFEESETAINDLYDEAYWLLAWTHQHFLTGEPRDQSQGLKDLDDNRVWLNSGEISLLDTLLAASPERDIEKETK